MAAFPLCSDFRDIKTQKHIHYSIGEYNIMQREYCRLISLVEYRHEYSRNGIGNQDYIIDRRIANTRPKIMITS